MTHARGSVDKSCAPGRVDDDAANARHCKELARHRDPDRYLLALTAPAAARRDLLALAAAEIELASTAGRVSEPMLGLIRLQWWREAVAEPAEGPARRHPVLLELDRAIRRHGLPDDLLRRWIDARQADLEPEPFADGADLERYIDDTAGIAMALSLRVLGAGDAASQDCGRQIARAWGRVGILRDWRRQAAGGKVRLPLAGLRAAGISAEDLRHGRGLDALSDLVLAALAAEARAALETARGLRKSAARAARPALRLAALAELYLGVLARRGPGALGALAAPPASLAWRRPWAVYAAGLFRRW